MRIYMLVCTYALKLAWKVRGIQEQLNHRSMCTTREHMNSKLLPLQETLLANF